MKKKIRLLAIETSCDETAAAVVENGRRVISSEVYSQIEHAKFGGVVPEVASRSHTVKINSVAAAAVKAADMEFKDIDGVAVTYGAGLMGALLVGVTYAKTLAYSLNKPLIAVNHIQGHIAANYINYPHLKPPFVCLVISGGHTALLKAEDYTKFAVITETPDDAAGEAFDKIARVLGLPYPGGPNLEKLAKEGTICIEFPAPITKDGRFSFSGLKTAVINYVNKFNQKKEEFNKADVAASFQNAVVSSVAAKCASVCKDAGIKKLCVAGGVAANSALREKIEQEAKKNGLELFIPEFKYCTDNAAMIGAQGYYNYIAGKLAGFDLDVAPSLGIED